MTLTNSFESDLFKFNSTLEEKIIMQKLYGIQCMSHLGHIHDAFGAFF